MIHTAGTVGGIQANLDRPADFLHDNVLIAATVLHAAWQTGVGKLLYLASACIYPRECPQPMRESSLLAGPLEPSNEPYAVAKIAGIKACQAYRNQYGCRFIAAMPTNVYGPGDHFDPRNSHVLAALVRKFHDGKVAGDRTVSVWGSGRPRRELLYVDDLADACLFLVEHYDDPEPINVGTGSDVSIAELAKLVREVVHPAAQIEFDPHPARRRPPQAARRRPAPPARLAPPDRTPRRSRAHLPMVPGTRGVDVRCWGLDAGC